MRLSTSIIPSSTATIARCSQCGAAMGIRLVEPDLKDPRKARHVFECEGCGLPRTYLIELGTDAGTGSNAKRERWKVGQSDTSRARATIPSHRSIYRRGAAAI
jgi:hypothetical protein